MTDRRVSGRAIAHLVMALVGVGVVVYGVVGFINPTVTCRGVVMQPGDECHKSSFTAQNTDDTQTYEQRLASARQSQPVIIGVGVALGGFGTALTLQETRRTRRDDDGQVADQEAHASAESPIGP